MENIDHELYNCASTLKYILPEDFHDRAIDKHAISIKEDKEIAKKMTNLINETSFKYAYTIVKKGGELFFVSSDIIEDPKTKTGTFYFYPYEEAGESFFKAFNQEVPTYKTVSDQWGTVRTVMIPEESPGGVKYLACVDYDISYVKGALQKNFLRAIVISLFFVFLAVPILIIYTKLHNKYLDSLKESEEKFRGIFESLQNGYVRTSMDGKILLCNEIAASMLGYEMSEFMNKNMAQDIYYDPDDRKKIREAILKNRRLTNSEIKLKHKNGGIIIVEANLHPVIENGKPVAIEGTFRDITEKKLMEQQVRENQEKFSKSFHYHSVAMLIVDLDSGERLELNNSLCELTEYSKEELLGKSLFKQNLATNQDQFNKIVQDLLTGEHVRNDPLDIQTKSGKNKQILISGSLMDVPDKQLAVLSWIDMTEQNEINKKLQQSQKMDSIGALAGGIAHDFNNILSSVIGYTELAIDDVGKGSAVEDHLHEVLIAGGRARDLVKQILAFARQSDNKNEPIQVNLIVKEVLKFIRASIPTSVEIKQNIVSDSIIIGNQAQVHQIMMNLCTNAAHTMENEGGILEVSLKDITLDETANRKKLDLKFGDYIEIKVSDTGVGIAPEIIESIFEPYFTTKGPGEGTGMGLAMVHGIVESYGGTIKVDSILETGSTFSIYLPITSKRKADRPYKAEILPTGSERILFVDDELSIAKMASQILERLGYQLTIHTSSISALELFRAKPNDFDLVISDMTMPNMTGDIMAIEMMKIRPDIPVILCTGYSKKISNESAAHIGIKAFAYKPIVKANLAKIVRKVLDEEKNSRRIEKNNS